MSSSPIDAISTAIERTRVVLFDPVDPSKYVAIALCAWLFRLGTGGASSIRVPDFGNSSSSGGGSGSPPFDPAQLEEMLAPLLALGAVLIAVVLLAVVIGAAIGAALIFLQSRGAFMLIDSLVKNRAEVVEPWNEYASEANSLFLFRLVTSFGSGALAFVIAIAAGAGVWFSMVGGSFDGVELAIIALGSIALLGVTLVASVVDGCSTEFVAPMMYVRRCTAVEAFGDLGGLASADPSGFAMYIVLRVASAILLGLLMAMVSCLLCCVSWLPFVSTLMFLPLIVWVRLFGMHFVAQLADDLRALGPTPAPGADSPLAF